MATELATIVSVQPSKKRADFCAAKGVKEENFVRRFKATARLRALEPTANLMKYPINSIFLTAQSLPLERHSLEVLP